MKVIIVGPAHPLRGGIATFTERLSEELRTSGTPNRIYSFSLQYPSILFPGKTQYTSDPKPPGLNIVSSINSINPLSWIKVGKMIQKENPDLIIINFWMPFTGVSMGKVVRIAKKHTNAKVIAIIHNLIPHEAKSSDKALTNYFLKSIDGLVALSGVVSEDINRLGVNKPLIVTEHPLYDHFGNIEAREEALKKLDLSADFKYIMFFGLVREYKGLDILLEAFAIVRQSIDNLKLIVAGEFYEPMDKYLSIISKNKMRKDVILTNGYVSDSQVSNYFNACDLVVQPYKTATQSGVTQIAYHFQKPMVVTNVGALPDMCPDEKVGYVVPPDSTSVAEAIIRFYNDTDIEKMKENILIEKKKYSWDLLVKRVLKLYKEL